MNFKIFARKFGGQFAPELGGQFNRYMHFTLNQSVFCLKKLNVLVHRDEDSQQMFRLGVKLI